MKKYSDLVNKQFKVNKIRNTYTVIGIILGIILFITVGYLNCFIKDVNIEQAKQYTGNYEAIFRDVSKEQLKEIKGNVKILNNGVFAKETTDKIMIGDVEKTFSVYSLDKSSYENIFNENIELVEGKLPTESKEIAVTFNIKGELNKDINDEINIENRIYKISGFYNNREGESKEFAGINMLDDDKEYNNLNIAINLKSNFNIRETILDIYENIGLNKSGYEIKFNELLINEKESKIIWKNNDYGWDLGRFLLNISIVILTSILTYGTINISMKERIQHFSTLRCIGATTDKIRWLLIKEGFILGGLSIIPGLIIGQIVSWAIAKVVLEKIIKFNFYGVEYKIYWSVVISTIILTTVTILISSIIPVIKSGKISPIKGVKTGGISITGLKKRKSRLIRSIFGYKGELAYKNIRGNNKSFILITITLSSLLIIFVSFTGYCKGALKGFNDELKRGKDFNISFYGVEFYEQNSALDIESEIDKIFEKRRKIESYIEETKSTTEIITQIDIRIKPIFKGFKSTNIISNEKTINNGEEEYTYIEDSKIIIYNDEALKGILPHIQGGNISLQDFKNNGIVLVNKNVKTKLFQNEYQSVTNLNPNDVVSLYIDEVNDSTEIKTNIIGNINSRYIYDWRNNDIENGIVIIASEKFYENNKVALNNNLINNSIFRFDFDFINLNKKDENIDRIRIFINEINGWYIDNELELLELERGVLGIAVITYIIVFIAMAIGVINIINNRTINIHLRKKEIGAMLAIGLNKDDLRKIIMLEAIVQWFISSLIGGIISYFILKIIYVAYEYRGNIEVARVPIWIIFIGIISLLIINIITSLAPLNKLKNINIVELIRGDE